MYAHVLRRAHAEPFGHLYDDFLEESLFSDGNLSTINGKCKRSINNGRSVGRPVYSVFRTATRVSDRWSEDFHFLHHLHHLEPGERTPWVEVMAARVVDAVDQLSHVRGKVVLGRQLGRRRDGRLSVNGGESLKGYTGCSRDAESHVVRVKNEYCKRSVDKTHTTFYGTWKKMTRI